MAKQDGITKPDSGLRFSPVNFTIDELDKLNEDIPRALALADILTIMDNPGSPKAEPESMNCCKAMLWDLLAGINGVWFDGVERQGEG